MNQKVSFEFNNQISPRYLQPLFLKIEPSIWYTNADLVQILRQELPSVDGKKIVEKNVRAWNMVGLGEIRVENNPRSSCFRLTDFGRFVQGAYSTNQELFFDITHYLFYSSWYRVKDIKLVRFWLYSQVCGILWEMAPTEMDSTQLTSQLLLEAQDTFPKYIPKFPERSVRSVFPWLTALEPPFLVKKTLKSQLSSERRAYCTPQLFHLAVDLIYYERRLRYGTSMAVGEHEIADICRVCLLDESKFWEMADRTKMFVRDFGIKQSQYGTSISLEAPPNWISLPDLKAHLAKLSDDNEGEDE